MTAHIDTMPRLNLAALNDLLAEVMAEVIDAGATSANRQHFAPSGPGTEAACGTFTSLDPAPDTAPMCPVCKDVTTF